jgi:hypothetical protein
MAGAALSGSAASLGATLGAGAGAGRGDAGGGGDGTTEGSGAGIAAAGERLVRRSWQDQPIGGRIRPAWVAHRAL